MSSRAKLAASLLGVSLAMPVVNADAAPYGGAGGSPRPNAQAVAEAESQPNPAPAASATYADSEPDASQLAAPAAPTAKPAAPADPNKTRWNGGFFGVFGGGSWAHSSINSNVGNLTSSSYFTNQANINSVGQNTSGTVYPSTPIYGIQLGNNVQSNSLVYGAILDFGSFKLNRSLRATNINYPSTAANYSAKAGVSTSWLASLRGRIGYAPCATMPFIYLTGGLALTNLNVFNNFGDTTAARGVGGGTDTKVKPGWLAGAGIEMPINPTWSVAGDYQYVSFGSNAANGFVTCASGTCSATRSPFSTAANLSEHIFKVALNYKLS